MARGSKTVVIGEHTYLITHWSASKGLLIMARLTKLLGESIMHLTGGAKPTTEEEKKEQIENSLALAMRALCEKLDEALVLQTVKEILETTCEGPTSAQADFETRFAGRMGHLLSVLVETVKFQYADFFEGTGGLLSRFAPVTK